MTYFFAAVVPGTNSAAVVCELAEHTGQVSGDGFPPLLRIVVHAMPKGSSPFSIFRCFPPFVWIAVQPVNGNRKSFPLRGGRRQAALVCSRCFRFDLGARRRKRSGRRPAPG